MKLLNYPSSGSYQGLTFSRNRFGQYVRSRAIPVNPNSSFQSAVRARLATNASNWRGLTAIQRAGWNDLGLAMLRTDALGQSYALTGYAAFCSVNNNLAAAGDAALTDAPALLNPDPLLTLTPTATVATLSLAYTATPLPAGARLFASLSPQRTAGRTFEGDYRLILVTAAAAASPANAFAAYQARFGTPIVGNKIFVSAAVYLGGFMSAPLTAVVTVA